MRTGYPRAESIFKAWEMAYGSTSPNSHFCTMDASCFHSTRPP